MVFGFGEGKIELKLERTSFRPGETLKGQLVLSLPKPKQARGLRVVFRGMETTTYWQAGKRRTTQHEVHRETISLGSEKEYSGSSQYGFEFVVPNVSAQQKPEGALGAAMGALSFLSGRDVRREWFVDASLDCPGFDINKKVQVFVNQ